VARKADVSYHDPWVARLAVNGLNLESQPLSRESLQTADCVVITTDHTAIDWELVGANARLVVDTRNALKGRPTAARVVKL
jgi:UDP-N-acetyl-D-glucosamine dehydrogenase